MTNDRRRFIQLASTLAAAGALPTLWSGNAQAARRLTGVTYLPPSYKALSFGSAGYVERLKAAAPDDVTIDFYDSGELLKADEQLPALRAGSIDFMFHTTSYITRSVPILGITGLPGVVEALYEHPERIARGTPLFDLINEQLAEDDLYMLSMGGGLLQPEYVWSTDAAPIRSIADLDGKKVRVVSFEATGVMESFGAAAVRIPSSELYLAMQRGTVDAAVANISTIIGRSIQETTSTLYELPVTGFGIGIFVSTKGWERMDDDVKDAMVSAAGWFDEHSAKEANDVIYPGEYRALLEKQGVEIVPVDAAAMEQLASAAEPVVAAWKKEVGEEVGARAIELATGAAEG